MNIYDFQVYDVHHELVSLSRFAGEMLLIFNSSPICYLTDIYTDIEMLYREFSFLGLEILDFPSDSFSDVGSDDATIDQMIVETYHTTFKRFAKVELRGLTKEPLFSYLENQIKFQGFDERDRFYPTLEAIVRRDDPLYKRHPDIKWNFTFFLISRDGEVLRRFEPLTKISTIRRAIKAKI